MNLCKYFIVILLLNSCCFPITVNEDGYRNLKVKDRTQYINPYNDAAFDVPIHPNTQDDIPLQEVKVDDVEKMVKHYPYTWIVEWSESCGPCVQTIPHILSYEKLHKDSIKVVLLDVNYEIANLRKRLFKFRVNTPAYIISNIYGNKCERKMNAFNSSLFHNATDKLHSFEGYPTNIIFNNTGKIVFTRWGEISQNTADSIFRSVR